MKKAFQHILNQEGNRVLCGGMFGRPRRDNDLPFTEVWEKLHDGVCRRCMERYVNHLTNNAKNEAKKQEGPAPHKKAKTGAPK